MTPWLDDGDVRLFHGDALDVLRELPSSSVDCIATSPPYWGLRDYGIDGQLGLESSPAEYVERMVVLFRECRRVLADHGTCWINLGDSYAQGNKGNTGELRPGDKQGTNHGSVATRRGERLGPNRTGGTDGFCKPKDLVGIPWRVAFALQDDGWYLRSDIIWAKPNPMPESVTDRPTKAHEYVFLLAKQPRYWFDQEAVRERWADDRNGQPYPGATVGAYSPPGQSPSAYSRAKGPDGRKITSVVGGNGSIQHRDEERWPNGGRNVRSVWEIATQPYPGAHFATFPQELVRRMVVAGCPVRVCRECGKPSERIVGEVDVSPDLSQRSTSHYCGHNAWRPGIVLDPFMGSGTTALVARNHQRHSVGIELNEDYLRLAADRLKQLSLLGGAA